MKKTFAVFCMALLAGVLLLNSCSSKEDSATIYDGETQWSEWAYNFALGETDEGEVGLWHVYFYTEIDNSIRTIALSMFTSERGTYSGVYEANNWKCSNEAIGTVRMTIDYDGKACPAWKAKSVTITIHHYDKKTKAMSATLVAEMVKEGTTETRNIKVKMDNLRLIEDNEKEHIHE